MRRSTKRGTRKASVRSSPVGLDAQFGELIETVWKCERRWTLEDRIDAAIKYRRN